MPDQPAKALGRPSKYSQKRADEICRLLAEGLSLREICRREDMPAESTVRNWAVTDHEGFFAQYAKARDVYLDRMADEIIEIADTPQIGVKTKETEGKVETTEGDMIEHRRLRVDSRKWYLSKLAPKRYGDKVTQEIVGAGGGPISVEHRISAADGEAKAALDAMAKRLKPAAA